MSKGTCLSSLGVIALGALHGCAGFASVDEFAAYRAVRYETNADERTRLGSEYVSQYPQGRFIAGVQGEVSAREETFWEERRSTVEGLQAYLDAYPSGTHRGEARARLDVYEGERRALQTARETREREERERLEQQRQAQNERQRTFMRETLLYWLRSTGAITGWGSELGEVARTNTEFAANFQNTPPVPVCRGGRCRKSYQLDFFVPVPGRSAQPRRLQMLYDLNFSERRLNGFSFTFANTGLAVWYERETMTAVLADQPATRDTAMQWSLANLRGIVAMVFPNARVTPPSLVGEDPEMGGDVADDTAMPSIGGDVVDDTPPATPVAPVAAATPPAAALANTVPVHPANTQFSFVVGTCASLGGAEITIPEGAAPVGFNAAAQTAPTVNGCLRIDGYTAIQGVNTDEGLRVTFIPAGALPRRGGPARPARRRGR
ncbi:MAG: hypothetical protein Q8Q09_29095 [Deltaproteobacteria bacterium]|nr:hypothetical protein [Deltaproteobacteria bacterium]